MKYDRCKVVDLKIECVYWWQTDGMMLGRCKVGGRSDDIVCL